MLVSLLALIVFQWYWIENAIAVKKEQFDRKVIESLNQTAEKIEKQEVVFLAQQKLKEQENLTLASLSEEPKPKRVLKKVKKRVPKSTTKQGSQNTALAHTKPIEPRKPHLKTQVKQPSDSIVFAYQPNGTVPNIDEYNLGANLRDFLSDERNLVPENRMRFIKDLVREQNMIWQQLGQRADEFIRVDQGINEIMSIVDNELSIVIQTGPGQRVFSNQQTRRRIPQENVQYQYVITSDGLPVLIPNIPQTQKHFADTIRKQNAFGANKPVAKQENRKEKEPEYEWVEVEEYVEESPEQKSKNKAKLVKDVFADFLQGDRDIHERLNREMLDTLLKQELANRGIDLEFEYGVKDQQNLMFASYAMSNNPSLAEESYSVKLFPNDALQKNQHLYVYFPERGSFIMSNMWSVFGSSAFLILMIGGIFYSSVSTMLKQKKLSMIKNDFINNMTHEFKTPISTISLAVDVMKDKSIKADPDKYLGIIKNENARLADQVEKVLQMALLDKGEVKLNLIELNLHEAIEQVAQNLGVQVEKKEGKINLDLKASNPLLLADEVHMTNILFNLIDNANKYSPEKPQINIGTEDIGSSIKLTISDNGIGMSKDQLNRIFEKFYRVSTGNVHDVKGFGLGLSYVQKMVNLHHGSIEVESRPGEGTTFMLTFNKAITTI